MRTTGFDWHLASGVNVDFLKANCGHSGTDPPIFLFWYCRFLRTWEMKSKWTSLQTAVIARHYCPYISRYAMLKALNLLFIRSVRSPPDKPDRSLWADAAPNNNCEKQFDLSENCLEIEDSTTGPFHAPSGEFVLWPRIMTAVSFWAIFALSVVLDSLSAAIHHRWSCFEALFDLADSAPSFVRKCDPNPVIKSAFDIPWLV
jgi:hypothetical protein